MQQIAVRRMNFDDAESGRQCPAGSRFKGGKDCIDARTIQGHGNRRTFGEGKRAGTNGGPTACLGRLDGRAAQPWRLTTCLPSGVGQLNTGDRALGMHETRDPGQWLDVPVAPNSHVAGEIRPSRVTAVASTITRATPPAARLPRCTRCQSLAIPSSATYWHMGDITMRLRKVFRESSAG